MTAENGSERADDDCRFRVPKACHKARKSQVRLGRLATQQQHDNRMGAADDPMVDLRIEEIPITDFQHLVVILDIGVGKQHEKRRLVLDHLIPPGRPLIRRLHLCGAAGRSLETGQHLLNGAGAVFEFLGPNAACEQPAGGSLDFGISRPVPPS